MDSHAFGLMGETLKAGFPIVDEPPREMVALLLILSHYPDPAVRSKLDNTVSIPCYAHTGVFGNLVRLVRRKRFLTGQPS